jgi:glutamate-1-semialdehyde 2,1-aminomutase
MEPINYEYPVNNFLEEVKRLTQLNGAILIFDETITGYRISRGGAQEEFKVIPDITTLGKGIANGYPLSAIAGRKEIMLEMENIFFSGTFGGELLSLAAAKAVISMHMESDISAQLASIGGAISNGIEKIVRENKMENILKLSGHPSWKFLNWSQSNGFSEKIIKTFFMQEMLKRGILVLSTHNVSLSIKEKHIQRILNTYGEVLSILGESIANKTIMDKLKATPIEALFKIR